MPSSYARTASSPCCPRAHAHHLIPILVVMCVLLFVAPLVIARVLTPCLIGHRDGARTSCTPRVWVSPAAARRQRAGVRAPAIPLHLYTYWDDDDTRAMPATCVAAIDTWRAWNPTATVTVLTPSSVGAHCPPADADLILRGDSPQHRSDLARTFVLASRGGVWLDASVLMGAPLVLPDASFCCYFLAQATAPRGRDTLPIIENWFFAAAPGDAFMSAWAAEMRGLARMGNNAYTEDALHRRHVDVQALASPHYLSMHVAAQAVLQRRALADGDASKEGAARARGTFADAPWDMHASAAEDGPFANFVAAGWNPSASVINKLGAFTRAPLVKLIGSQRDVLEHLPTPAARDALLRAFLPTADDE